MRVSLMKNSLFFKARPGVLAPLKAAGRPPPHPPRISVTPLRGRARERCGVVRFLGGVGAAPADLAPKTESGVSRTEKISRFFFHELNNDFRLFF